MKKLLSFILLLISFNSFAQNQKEITLVSNKNQVGIYDEDQRVFKWSDVNYAEIQIQFTDDNFVRLSNVNESIYQIIKSEGTDSGKTETGMEWIDRTWSAIDKKSRKCKISLTKYADGDITFSVLYQDICFRYYIVIPIDKFQ